MNVVEIKKAPSGLAHSLRELADKVDAGAVTDVVLARVEHGNYEFLYAASLASCVVMAALLQQSCIDRMRR
jgi:hypothetical protein